MAFYLRVPLTHHSPLAPHSPLPLTHPYPQDTPKASPSRERGDSVAEIPVQAIDIEVRAPPATAWTLARVYRANFTPFSTP